MAFPKRVTSLTKPYEEHYIEIRGYENYPKEAKKMVKTLNYDPCSCVSFAKSLTGFNEVVGAARNWPINSKIPSVGSVVILNENAPGTNSGHVALITNIVGNEIWLKEANFVRCKVTTRIIKNDYDKIIGYYN